MKTLLALLVFVSLSFAQFQINDYTVRHFTNPPAQNVNNYIYWYWEGNDFNACPLQEDMTYDEAMATVIDTLDFTTTTVDTVVSGIILLQDNGLWHCVGCIAENNLGQKSRLTLSPFRVKPSYLTDLLKVRGLIIERNP